MRMSTILVFLALTACDAAPRSDNQPKLEKSASADAILSVAPKAAAEPDDSSNVATRTSAEEKVAEGSSLCWQDYCPCDNPVTALDRTICRNARGGIEMSDDQWAIGAEARDMKYESDRLSNEMDDVMSDVRAQRSRLRATSAAELDATTNGSDY